MKILFITHAFNSLTQRLWVERDRRGQDVSIEFDINDAVTIEAVEQFRPTLIIARHRRGDGTTPASNVSVPSPAMRAS